MRDERLERAFRHVGWKQIGLLALHLSFTIDKDETEM